MSLAPEVLLPAIIRGHHLPVHDWGRGRTPTVLCTLGSGMMLALMDEGPWRWAIDLGAPEAVHVSLDLRLRFLAWAHFASAGGLALAGWWSATAPSAYIAALRDIEQESQACGLPPPLAYLGGVESGLYAGLAGVRGSVEALIADAWDAQQRPPRWAD